MESYSLTVLGSGLSCLHLLARLPPRLLEETLLIPSDSDQLSGWSAHLRRAGARLLRLPINQSPHKDPGALSAWANHEDQLQDMDVSHNDSLPLPSIQLLETFCHQQIMNKLPARITRSDMLCAASLDEDDEGTGYVLTLSDQREIKTKAVVYTETPAVPVVPTWARSLWHSGGQQQEGCPCIQHSSQLDVRDGRTSGQRVAVVGGGMTAASLALAATAAGAAHVHLISRRQLQEQEQEVDPGWFGSKLMRGYQSQKDPRQRLLAAREARPHATINAHTMRALRQTQAAGPLTIWEGQEVATALIQPNLACTGTSHVGNPTVQAAADDTQPVMRIESSLPAPEDAEAGCDAGVGQTFELSGQPSSIKEGMSIGQAAAAADLANAEQGSQAEQATAPGKSGSADKTPSHSTSVRSNIQSESLDEHRSTCPNVSRGPQAATAAAGSCWKLQLRNCRSKASDHQDEQDGSGDELPVDCIWLATGSSPDAMACPFLTSVQQQWPTRLLGGYPCLQDASLAWPGIPLLFIGRMTLLSQGPAAALMPGMRKAADIVMASLLQHLTGSRGPGRLNGGTTADDHDPSVSRPDDADITLDGCGLMPEQLISKVHVRTNPHIIDVSDLPASMERLEIQKYNFADDEFEVMVLFDLPEPVSKDQVRVRFETSSVEMWATGRQAYRLYIPRLYGTIVPSKCNLRIRHCKIALQLRKTSDAEWRFLRG
ncbi:hypothetical protein WJX74_003593 [Apatococcus lobatus]|uniref:CS domain-containing protein n=1 Tax=Apatococcus lobatus TaxID=904363 RepID=A0AAW1RJ82_9CHLO